MKDIKNEYGKDVLHHRSKYSYDMVLKMEYNHE